jgi:hypothetical protein
LAALERDAKKRGLSGDKLDFALLVEWPPSANRARENSLSPIHLA